MLVVGNVHTYVQMIHCGESALWGKYTHTYKRYIMGKVHCGENLCILVVVVGKIHTYENWYIVGKVHCGENLCVLVGVVGKISFPHNANFISPQCNVLICVTHYSERRMLKAIRRSAYRYTDQSRTCPRITHARTMYGPCT